ncbi:MAG: GNAT family N-acetyltransferase [Acidobacteriota bacterium]
MSGPEGVQVRRYDAADFEEVVRLWRAARIQVMPELEARMGHSPEDDATFFREQLLPENETWVVVEGGDVRGFLARKDDLLGYLYVDPSHQRRGLGSRLFEKARELIPGGFHLYTHQANTMARSFYEARGMKETARGVSPAPESEPDVRYGWTP